jgi:ribosomal protein L11 methyltransferase
MTEVRYPFVHVEVPVDEADEISSALWDLGATGVEERDSTTLAKSPEGTVTLVGSFENEEDATDAVAELTEVGLAPRLEFVVGDAWRDEWRKYFKPTRLGERIVIRPSWEPFEAQPGDVVVTIDPGRAFGSGLHETTRLVLRAIDARLGAADRILDVGCGSGILAVAGILLGAKSGVATDNDPDAVEVTNENALLNGVADRLVASVDDVSLIRDTFPFVVANIEARVLIPLAASIAARVAPGGTLVLSGILRGQEDDVRAAYAELELVEIPTDGEWVAIVLRRVS